MKRSDLEKKEYFKNHCIAKKQGFELHHIIPLFWSENEEDFKLYDSWKNMIYISAYEHSIITQSMKKIDYVQLSSHENNNNLEISDIGKKEKILFELEKNLLYNPIKKETILNYNREMLKK